MAPGPSCQSRRRASGRRRPFPRPLGILLLGALCCGASLGESATEPGETTRFLRVFVPAERTEDWPRGEGRYLPMDAATFEDLTGRLRQSVGPSGPRLVALRGDARLEGDRLLRGRATLEVVQAAGAPGLLSLGACGLAIHGAAWRDRADEEAILGLSEKGQTRLLVPRSGTLDLDWSLAGSDTAEKTIAFSLNLPGLPTAQLQLNLPESLVPEVEGGLVVPLDPSGGRKTWRIEPGGRRPIVLRLLRSGSAALQETVLGARQKMVYDFSPGSLEVKADLRLDASATPRSPLPVVLDPPLRMVAASWGDRPASWTVVSAGDASPQRLLVEPPRQAADAPLELRLGAIAPLPASRRPWLLPRVRLEGVLWQEGDATLLVPQPLRLEQLEGFLCRQSKVEPLAAPRVGQAVGLQYFSADATAQVVLGQPLSPPRIDRGTTVELGPSGVTAVIVAALRMEEGRRFELRAKLKPGWLIDRVESIPAGAIADWDLRTEANQEAELILRLAKPLVPSPTPLRLSIAARRLESPLGRVLDSEDLAPLEFLDARMGRDLMAVRAAESCQVVPRESEPLSRWDPARLDAEAAALFVQPPGGLVFSRDAASESLRVTLTRRKPSFSGFIEATVTAGGGMLRESHRLRCVPESSRMDHLLVHFSDDRPEAWQFTLDAAEDPPLAARRLPPSEQAAAGLGPEGQTWDVPLVPSRSAPFEVWARRGGPLVGRRAIALASLPEAAAQQARLSVHAADAAPLAIENHRLEPIPCEPAPPGRPQTALAAYRYDPTRAVSSEGEPSLAIAPKEAGSTPDAVAWSASLDSRYRGDGAAQHTMVCQIENLRRRQLRVSLPPGVELSDVRGASLDGQPVAFRTESGPDRAVLVIDLPPGAARPTVSIDFDTTEPALGSGRPLEPPMPAVDVVVLGGQWTAWLPPGYEALDAHAGPGLSWTERLFGPLGRGANRHRVRTDAPGWTACRVELTGVAPGVTVVHRDRLHALRWLALLAVFALGQWRRLDRPEILVAAGGLAAGGALLLPATGSVVASGALLGVLLRGGFHALRRVRGLAAAAPTRARVAARAAVGATLALLAAGALASMAAPSASAEVARVSPPPHRVLIPVDKDRKPVGGRVYVPEQLLRELSRLDAAQSGQPEGWLLATAVYRAALSWQGDPKRLLCEEVNGEYDLRVLGPAGTIRLPLRREAVKTSVGAVQLDGRPVDPRWDEADGSLLLDVPGPGAYRLEVVLQPASRSDKPGQAAAASAGVDVAIPPVASARLELALPPGAADVEVPSARGAVTSQGEQLTAQLGGASQLSVSWPEGPSPQTSDTRLEVDELLWLKIAPGSVVLETRLTYHVLRGQVGELLLEVDPRLRLLEPPPGMKIESEVGSPELRRVVLSEPASQRIVFEARFLVTETSGVGNLRLPRLVARGPRSTRRWFAVSVDPALRHQVTARRPLPPVSVPDFVKAWGSAPAQPVLARSFADENAVSWSIATAPSPPETTVDETVLVSLGPKEVQMRLDATLRTTPGYGFRHAVALPPDLEIESVRVLEEGADRLSEWSRAADGALHLALSGPAAGARTLLLEGRLPLAGRRQIDLPIPRVESARLASCRVAVFRRPGVSVTLGEVVGLAVAEPPAPAGTDRSLGWLVQSFSCRAGQPRARVFLQPSRPRIEVTQVTSIRGAGPSHEVLVDAEVVVREGVLDEVSLDVPPELAGPYRVQPPMGLSQFDTAGSARRLVLRPETPVTDRCRFTLVGRLAGEPAEVPDVVVRHAERTRRFLLLPAKLEDQPVRWETRGLRRAELPESPAVVVDSPSAPVAYEVTAETFLARRMPSPPVGGSPRVALADVGVAWQTDGTCRGVACFDLVPAGRASCPLELPEGYRLVRLSIEGVVTEPAPGGPRDPGRWQIPLISRRLPQRIEVAFSGRAPRADAWGGRTLDSPRLGSLPVATTLWSVWGPPSQEAGARESSTALAHERARTASLASLLDATIQPGRESSEELTRWFATWDGRLRRSCDGLARALASQAGEEGADDIVQEALDATGRTRADVLRRLAIAPAAAADAAPPASAADPFRASLPEGLRVVRLIRDDAPGEISIAYRPALWPWYLGRLPAALGIAALAALGCAGIRRGTLPALVRRWPHAMGLLAGAICWLCLQPSALGALLAALVLLHLARSVWSRRHDRADSAVVPLGAYPKSPPGPSC